MRRFALAALLCTWNLLASAETWSFALLGDTPYSDYEREQLPKMFAAITESGAKLVLHIGDFKHGHSRCDDSVFADRQELFATVPVPFVFVPGDNDWLDCARVSNGGYDPLERLEKLRKLFWPDNRSLGQRPITLQRQAGRPEHSRFRYGPVLFVTLNVPGHDNNYGIADKPQAEFESRTPQILAWLREGFARARKEQLRGIVIALQANPGFRQYQQGIAHPGFKSLLETLQEESNTFPGQVLFLHGDTHSHQINQPLMGASGEILRNFTRIESYGFPFLGWVKVTIDDGLPALFRFESNPWQPH